MIKNNRERLVKIRIVSCMGDKVNVKLPMEFVKKMVKNNTIDFLQDAQDVVDSQKLLKLLTQAFDYNLVGEVAFIERKNGDTIRVIID